MSKKKAMFFKGASGGGSDTDADAFITAAGITDTTIQDAITNLVLGLKDETRAGGETWSKYHAIYPFASDTGTSAQRAVQHKWNLKNPLDTDAAFRGTFAGTVTHSNTGVQSDGSTGYMNSYYKPDGNGTDNNISLGYYSRDDISDSAIEIGSVTSTASRAYLLISYNGGSTEFDIYDTSSRAGAVPSSTSGWFFGSRQNATDSRAFRNGVQLGATLTSVSGGIPNRNIYIMAGGNGGLGNSNSNRECAFATIGLGLTPTEVSDDYDVIQAYQTALGREV